MASGFYADKDLVRHTFILHPEYHERLKAESKALGLTQGEIIEVIMDNLDLRTLDEQFVAKRNEKVMARAKDRGTGLTKASVIKKMKGLTQEKLAAINAIVEKEQ